MRIPDDEDGRGVFLQRRLASQNAACQVHALLPHGGDGWYRAASTNHHGVRAVQSDINQPEVEAIMWMVVRPGGGDSVHIFFLLGAYGQCLAVPTSPEPTRDLHLNQQEMEAIIWQVGRSWVGDYAVHVLLPHGAYAHDQYVAASATPAPADHRCLRVVQTNLDHPEVEAMAWQVVRSRVGDGHIGLTVDDLDCLSAARHWMVAIPGSQAMPPLPSLRGPPELNLAASLFSGRNLWEVSPARQRLAQSQAQRQTRAQRAVLQVPRREIRYLRRWVSDGVKFLERLAKRLLLPLPRQYTWRSIMAEPMAQTVPNLCVLVACTVCIESIHRLEFERLYGTGSFVCKAACPRELRRACLKEDEDAEPAGAKPGAAKKKIWDPIKGALFEPVLRLIITRGGVPTINTPRRRILPLMGFQCHELYDGSSSTWRVTPQAAARLLYVHGPCLAALFTTWSYFLCCNYDDDEADPGLFTGGPRDCALRKSVEERDPCAGMHAVVCYAFRFVGEQLHLRVLDNQTTYGPRRWVLYEAFEALVTLRVQPLDP